MKYFLFLAFTTLVVAKPNKPHPLSDEFIDSINTKQSAWKAGRNFNENVPMSTIRNLLGVLPKKLDAPKLPYKTHPVKDVPESFDSREAWPDCAEVIGEIRDQANCGSCWAFGAAEAMSDRICIASNATLTTRVSSEDLNSCCVQCGEGCNGGWPDEAWLYWQNTGIVTGGLYNTSSGCKPYSIPPCDHHVENATNPCGDIVNTPECTDTCYVEDLVYKDELTFGSAYKVLQDEQQIQLEIMTHGSVEASFDVYSDFLSYKTGVYYKTDGEYEGGHAVKIIGWGVENDLPYWLAANSWNTNWGDGGYFKILRNADEVRIEEDIVAGLPQL